MKRIFLIFLSCLPAVFLWACSRSDWGHPSLPWAPTEAADHDVIWMEADLDDTQETTVPPEDVAREWVEQYLDLSQYQGENGEGTRYDIPIPEIRVHGILLTLGMGYEEVIAAGFTPDEDWSNDETDGMIVTQNFSAPNGKTVTLDFWGPEGSLLRQCKLRAVRLEEEMDFHVADVGESFTLEMILDALGDPTRLRIIGSKRNALLALEYRFTGRSGCLEFLLDPREDKILKVDLWGAD